MGRRQLSAAEFDEHFTGVVLTFEPGLRFERQQSGRMGWAGYARRVDRDMLAEAGFEPERRPRIYACGPTGFVEGVARDLVALGHDPSRIRLERFGATGG